MIGELIGNFRIVARLGEGGMGEVFVAEQQQIHTKVAIKMLLAKISENHEIVQRFFNEAIAVSKIQHSGIVKIFDVGFHGPRAYLVMEYLDGETLSSRIKRQGQLSLPEIADIGRQISSVLEAVHKAGITHRDLKPDNIFLVPDAELPRGERVKILDFGIAKLTGAGVGMTSTSASSMGTPLYMSPEQWMSSGKVDWRADAYSIGCVLFEMITGKPPFTGESIGQLCAHHLSSPAPRVGQVVPVPPQLDELVARLLAKAPDERPASMREVAQVFSSLEGAAPSSAYAAMRGASGAMSSAQSASLAQAATMAPVTQPETPRGVRAPAINTTLGSAAASSDVFAAPAKSKKPLAIIGGLLLAGAAAAGAFAVLKKPEPPAKPAATEPAQRGSAVVASTDPATPPAKPAGTTPETTPAESKPVETKPAETKPGETKPAETKPVDKTVTKTTEPKNVTKKPADKTVEKTGDKKPATADKKPADKPAEPTPPPVDPNLPDKIDRSMIKPMIAKLKGQFEVCRTKNPGGGTILVQVQVKPDGSTGDVVFLRTPSAEVSKCALAKIQETAKFPATKNGGSWKAQFDVPGAYLPDGDDDDAPAAKPAKKTRK